MANRKSMLHTMVEDLRNSSPPQFSPLRRRSSVAPPTQAATELEENDDEAERLTRRKEQNQPASSRNDKRQSFGLSSLAQLSHLQITEKVSQCIKLSAENKINVKNAFNLEMIDFMTYMIKKQDANMSNLQMASTSLDVSTKIYGFRVDGVYTDILKMTSGHHDKQEKNDAKRQGNEEDGEPATADNDGPPETQTRNNKKRRCKKKILSSVEALRGSVATVNPASLMFDEADSQTTDLLYQAILPHHATNGLYLNDYNDVILDTVNPSRVLAIDATSIACPKIDIPANAEMCQSFANFEFLGYSPEDEDTDVDQGSNEPSVLDKSTSFHDPLQFDLDASLPPDEGPVYHGSDVGISDTENVERCRIEQPAVDIVDFREAVVRTAKHCKESEYSYFQDNIGLRWAGPNYWKIRFSAKNLGGSRIVEGCGQEAVRRRKELLLAYNDETRNVSTPKYDTTRSNLVKIQTKTARTWSEEKLVLPQDMHYDANRYSRLYLKPGVVVNFTESNSMNATHVSDEIGDYDYENENDTADYCPNIECDDQPGGSSCIAPTAGPSDFDEEIGPTTQAFTGDNLVEAPKVNSKIFISYSQRAKKIDMRQLKKCIWKDLTRKIERSDLEANDAALDATEKVTEAKKFSDVYKNLPKTLSKANVEALSFPIAFMSLLHLANEKTLKITPNEDNSELFVEHD